jgi:hypothetical protein
MSLSPLDVAALQRAVGNRAVQRLLARPPDPPNGPAANLVVQAKLEVGAANDSFEHEADQVAKGVMRQINTAAAGPRVQRVTIGPPGNEDIDYVAEPEEEAEEQERTFQGPASRAGTEDPATVARKVDDGTSLRLKAEARGERVVGLQGGAAGSPCTPACAPRWRTPSRLTSVGFASTAISSPTPSTAS